MLRYKKILIFWLLAVIMILNPLSIMATHVEGDLNTKKGGPDPAVIIADLVVARPLGLVVTVIGSAVFIVALPFAALGDNVDEVKDSLVITPAEYTFQRPLGRFED